MYRSENTSLNNFQSTISHVKSFKGLQYFIKIGLRTKPCLKDGEDRKNARKKHNFLSLLGNFLIFLFGFWKEQFR